MISKEAIYDYVNRDLGNIEAEKLQLEYTCYNQLELLNPKPRFKTKPYRHQLVSFLISLHYDNLLLFMDMGIGKTKVMLDTFSYLRKLGKRKRALVLVPTINTLDVWERECLKHTPHLRISTCEGSPKERYRIFWKKNTDIVVITYAGLTRMFTVPKVKGARSLVANVKSIGERFDFVVYDECTALKGHNTKISVIARELVRQIPRRYGLTGTPIGSTMEDLWAQAFAVDGGKAFGNTLGLFRAAFFRPKRTPWGVKWVFKRKTMRQVNRIARSVSIRYLAENCVDLPETVSIEHVVPMPEDVKKHYDKALDDIMEVVDDSGGVNTQVVANKFNHLWSLASGFLTHKGDDGIVVKAPLTNMKIPMLLEILDGIPKYDQVVIFHHYIYSGKWIESALIEQGHNCVWVYSGTKGKKAKLDSFYSGKTRILVINDQSGALGLNLQNSNRVIFYETPVSPIVWQQAVKRCHRIGGNRKVFYHYILTEGSIDHDILGNVKRGRNLLRDLMRGRETSLGIK